MSSYDCMLLGLQSIVAICTVGLCVTWLLRQLKVGQYDDKYVFITGSDTGFGFLLAQRLDKMGLRVFAGCLTQNGAKNVQKNCSKNVTVVDIDVTKVDSIEKAKAVVKKHLPKNKGLWAVVNNAGIAGPVAPTDWLTNEDFERTIGVNLMGVIYVTKAFLSLVRREEGRIVNMASICGRLAIATAPYNAAKFGVEGFTDSLRHELYKTGVSVSVIEPGFFTTGIVNSDTISQGLDRKFDNLDRETKQYYGKAFKDSYSDSAVALTTLVLSSRLDKVVDSYVHAVTARFPKVRYTVGLDANILFRFLMHMPDWFTDVLFGFLQQRPAAKQR